MCVYYCRTYVTNVGAKNRNPESALLVKKKPKLGTIGPFALLVANNVGTNVARGRKYLGTTSPGANGAEESEKTQSPKS
jgi:hypothetical protein